jgi:RNA polymerase sigma-70 factor (ECF subfamily)
VSVENPVAYAFTVARNESARKQQRQGRERGTLSGADLFELADRNDCESHEAAEAVAEALASLGHEQREVIELKFYSGLTFREVANVLGIPQGTAATRYRAALDKLRSILAKEWS